MSDPGRDVADLLARLVAVDSANPGLVTTARRMSTPDPT